MKNFDPKYRSTAFKDKRLTIIIKKSSPLQNCADLQETWCAFTGLYDSSLSPDFKDCPFLFFLFLKQSWPKADLSKPESLSLRTAMVRMNGEKSHSHNRDLRVILDHIQIEVVF